MNFITPRLVNKQKKIRSEGNTQEKQRSKYRSPLPFLIYDSVLIPSVLLRY